MQPIEMTAGGAIRLTFAAGGRPPFFWSRAVLGRQFRTYFLVPENNKDANPRPVINGHLLLTESR